MHLMSLLCNSLRVKAGKIVFHSYTRNFADNPRSIAEELLRRGRGYDYVWVATSTHTPLKLPQGIRSAVGHYAMRYELSTAQVIVSDARLTKYWSEGFCKKPGQLYIQTWHGSCGIKKMEGDMHQGKEGYLRRARADSQNIDYLLSNNRWLTQAYRSSFFYSGEILETGSPRNDILLRGMEGRAAEARAILGVPLQYKLLLYAPTFRDGKEATAPPLPDWEYLRRALNAKWGGEWIILVRAHPNVFNKRGGGIEKEESEKQIDVSCYADMADLLATADVFISDYSGCMFDWLHTGRPGFIYAPDRREYEESRGLYYPLSETPFAIAETNEELAKVIRDFDEAAYRARVESFLKGKGCTDDGHASERVADLIERFIERGGAV